MARNPSHRVFKCVVVTYRVVLDYRVAPGYLAGLDYLVGPG